MPYVLVLLGVSIALAFWWPRTKKTNRVAAETVGTGSRAFREVHPGKIAASPLAPIDNPLDAAATVILALVAEGRPLPGTAHQEATRLAMQQLTDWERAKEAAFFAEWAVVKTRNDALAIIAAASGVLNSNLTEDEKHRLIFLIDEAVEQVSMPAGYKRMRGKLADALEIDLARQTAKSL